MDIQLFEAAEFGDCEKITYWLAQGANINFRNPVWKGATPLFAAAKGGHEAAVVLLIARGAHLDAVNDNGWPSLRVACEQLWPHVICRLLASGASLTSECAETAARQTLSLRQTEVLALLRWASVQSAVNLLYFLPLVYADAHHRALQHAKETLLSVYTSFDAAQVVSAVDEAYRTDPSFHLQMPVVLRRIVRQHGLSAEYLEIICRDLMREDLQNNVLLLTQLSQIVKYAVLRGTAISVPVLLDILRFIAHESVQYEIIWALAYALQKQNVRELETELLQRLHTLLKSVTHPAKAQLMLQEEREGEQRFSSALMPHKKSMATRLRRAPRSEVTKQLHTAKTVHRNKHTEESEVNVQGLIAAIKSKFKQVQTRRQQEQVPTVTDTAGDDRTWYYGTYNEVLSLYARAHQNGKLKHGDKDAYLPAKFLDNRSKWFSGGTLGDFFIDRMIARIFRMISVTQKLNEETFNKLMLCIGTLDQLKITMFGTMNSELIAPRMINEDICRQKHKSDPEIVAHMAQRLYAECLTDLEVGWFKSSYRPDVGCVMDVVSAELESLRVDAMQAICHSVLRDSTILSRADIKKIEGCLSGSNKELKKVALKILGTLPNSTDLDYKKVFNKHLAKLEKNTSAQEVQEALDYIVRQLHDKTRSSELFSAEVILRILICLHRVPLSSAHQSECLDIVSAYLEQAFATGLLLIHLENLVIFIRTSADAHLIEEALKIILVHSDKTKTLDHSIRCSLVLLMSKFSNQAANLFVMMLVNILDEVPLDFNAFSFKLLDANVVVQDLEGVRCVPRSRDNVASPAISMLTAKIISHYVSLPEACLVTRETVMNLAKAVNASDKQTRILSAKALFLASEARRVHDVVDYEILFEIQSVLCDPILDISVYATVFYVESLYRRARERALLPSTHLNFLSQVYAMDELHLEDREFGYQINLRILDIVQCEVHKKQKLDEGFCAIFEFLCISTNGHVYIFIKKWLDILSEQVIVNKFSIPDSTIAALENYLSVAEYDESVLKILSAVVRNGQAVGEQTLVIFRERLLHSNDQAERRNIYECLSIADIHQDLPDTFFNLLEVERAAFSIIDHLPDEAHAWLCLERAVSRGEILTQTVFAVLVAQRDLHASVLRILKQTALNKQSLPDAVIHRLSVAFKSGVFHRELMQLFLCVVQNNQELPAEFLEILEDELENPAMVTLALSIFLTKAQQGESVSGRVMHRIFEESLRLHEGSVADTEDRLALKQGCLASICTMLQKGVQTAYAVRAEEVFCNSLSDTHPYVLKLSLQGLGLLQKRGALSQSSVTALVLFMEQGQEIALRIEATHLLQGASLNAAQSAAVTLMNLACESDEAYLKECDSLAMHGGLFKNNFDRLRRIVVQRSDLQLSVLVILDSCPHLRTIPHDLTDHIAVLKASSTNASIRDFSERVLAKASTHTKEEADTDVYLLYSPIITEKLSDAGRVCHAIVDKKFSVALLKEYQKLIPTLAPEVLARTVAVLIEYFQQIEDREADTDCLILRCIVVAVQSGFDISVCQDLFATYLQSDDERIRDICFQFFIELRHRGVESSVFLHYCENLKETLQESMGVVIDDWELLRTISSLQYLSFPVDLPISSWTKALIISDFAVRWQLSTSEQVTLYAAWSELEKQFEYPDVILKLLHANLDLSFEIFLEVIKFLPILEYAQLHALLILPDVSYIVLRQAWLNAFLLRKVSLETIDKHYLNQLLFKMVTTLAPGVAEKIIFSVESIGNILELESLIDFIHEQGVLADQLDANLSLSALKNSLEIKLLANQFNVEYTEKLSGTLKRLLAIGWTFHQLNDLVRVSLLESTQTHRAMNLFHVFHLLADYEFSSEHCLTVKKIICEEDTADWLPVVNTRVINHHFSQTALIKSPAELMHDFYEENSDNPLVAEWIAAGLLSDLHQINNPSLYITPFAYNRREVDYVVENFYCEWPISQWNRDAILAWAEAVKSVPDYFDDPSHIVQALAIAKRANVILTRFQLTDTQLLACLIALKFQGDYGLLLQVETGGGKTIVISILAIFEALRGTPVDIATSSPVDAENFAREQAPLYQLFGITVADNLDRTPYFHGPKQCYTRQVVYGEVSQFQFDALRDEYGLLGTKAGRGYGKLIADEVDSMLIDDSTKIAKLSSNVAGMDQLQPVYYFLSNRVSELLSKIHVVGGALYLFYERVQHEAQGMVLYYEKEGDIEKIVVDLEQYVMTHTDIAHIGQRIPADVRGFIEEQLTLYLHELMAGDVLRIPVNFKEFVRKQSLKWIKNAMAACSEFQDRAQYLVQNQLVKPVAFNSNGTVQNFTQWSDGLHQFLQLKHELAITSETFTTNFESNLACVRRYGSRMCGFTGTLGSRAARQKLTDTYHVHCVEVPSVRAKQYKSLPTYLVDNVEAWLFEIYFEVMHEIKKGRGVLIICRIIDGVFLLENFIKSRYLAAKIKTYTANGCDQEQAIQRILPGDIIIATSLAGRNRDIKADAVNPMGGMHVILAGELDDRNAKQALHRTSRQGKLGTGRKIINKQDLLAEGYTPDDFDDLAAATARYEAQQLDDLFGHELKRIDIKDQVFQKFCRLIREIRLDIRRQSKGVLADIKETVVALFSDWAPSVYEITMVAAIEEQWAMFLRDIDDGVLSIESVHPAYELFAENILRAYREGTIIQNPCHHIVIANDLLFNSSWMRDTSEEAMRHFDAAIARDKRASPAAYVGKAWLYLKTKQSLEDVHYKQRAIAAFEEAVTLLYDEIAHLNMLQTIMQDRGASPSSPLMRQLIKKVSLLGSYLRSVEANIQGIKRSQRLMTLTESRTYQSTHPRREDTYHRDILQEAVVTPGLERQANKTIGAVLLDERQYQVQFHDLTERHDMTTIDQAMNTVCAVSALCHIKREEGGLGSHYKGVSILLRDIDLAAMQSFLSPHTTFNRLSKASAAEKLSEKTSFMNRMTGSLFASTRVTVEIFSGEHRHTHRESVSMRDAATLVKAARDTDLISLCFLNVNETLQALNVEFLKISQADVHTRLESITATSIDIELSGNREKLLQIISAHAVTEIQWIHTQGPRLLQTTLHKEAAMRTLAEMTESSATIKLTGLLDKSVPSSILTHCEDLTVHLSFNAVNVPVSLAGLTAGSVNVNFAELSCAAAEPLIVRLRSESIAFAVSFDQLNGSQAAVVIAKADVTQEDIQISGIKSLSTVFPDHERPELELGELSARGIEHLLEVGERRFVPWYSIFTICMLAGIQVTAGAALIVSGFGATVGMGLVTEGVADFVTACRVGISREITWEHYLKQKAVSLVISATCMGWQALKDAGKGVTNLVAGLSEEVLEQAGTQVIMNGRAMGATLVQSTQQLQVLAFRQVGITVVESGAREVLNHAANTLSHVCFEQFKPKIVLSIRDKVSVKFCDSTLKKYVAKLYALDQLRRVDVFQNRIDYTTRDILNPKHSFWRRQWDAIGLPLCQGILSAPQYLGSSFSMGVRVMAILNSMDEIMFVIGRFHGQLAETLGQIDQDLLSLPKLLEQDCGLTSEESVAVADLLVAQRIVSNYQNLEGLDPALAHLGVHQKHQVKITQFLTTLRASMISVDVRSLISLISGIIADHIIATTQTQLIMPATSYVVASGVNSLSARFQNRVMRQELSSEMDSMETEFAALAGSAESKEEDHNRMHTLQADIAERSHRLAQKEDMTFAQGIMYQAQRKTIAYSQRACGFFASPTLTGASVSDIGPRECVEKYAQGVADNKPANISDMNLMADLNAINLKIVDDPEYCFTDEDRARNAKVAIFVKGKGSADGSVDIGHWRLMNEEGRFVKLESNDNDCGYALISELMEGKKSVKQLRSESAQAILKYSEHFYLAIEAQNWLTTHHPRAANDLLFNGGWNSKIHKHATNQWCKDMGFSAEESELISDACDGIDIRLKPDVPQPKLKKVHGCHFNTGKGEAYSPEDTRIIHAVQFLNDAIVIKNSEGSFGRERFRYKVEGDEDHCKITEERYGWFFKRESELVVYDSEMIPEYRRRVALMALGEALHPLQDMHAHTPEFVHKVWKPFKWLLGDSFHWPGAADDPRYINPKDKSPASLDPADKGCSQRYTMTKEATKFILQCYKDNRIITAEELSSLILAERKTCAMKR